MNSDSSETGYHHGIKDVTKLTIVHTICKWFEENFPTLSQNYFVFLLCSVKIIFNGLPRGWNSDTPEAEVRFQVKTDKFRTDDFFLRRQLKDWVIQNFPTIFSYCRIRKKRKHCKYREKNLWCSQIHDICPKRDKRTYLSNQMTYLSNLWLI